MMNAACETKPFDLFAKLKHLMVVGIDCYHDTSAGKRSIGALVASLNQGMTRLVSTWGGGGVGDHVIMHLSSGFLCQGGSQGVCCSTEVRKSWMG